MIYVLIAISLLFVATILLRRLSKFTLCAICVSISLTWLALLVLYKTGRFHDQALLALLMGQSVTGIYYLVRKKVPPVLKIFTLPFFLSLTYGAYLLITSEVIIPVFVLLSVLWIAGWLVFSFSNDPAGKKIAKAAMECCED